MTHNEARHDAIIAGIGVAAGTDTYTVSMPEVLTYSEKFSVRIIFTNANTTAATININGLGAKAIIKAPSTPLLAGDIPAGKVLNLIYDGTSFQVIGIVSIISSTISNAPLPLQTKIMGQTPDGSNVRIDGNVINKLSALNGFLPTDLASCVGWWDFTDSSKVTASAGLISQITDKSIAANHLVQATGGSQPAYTPYGGISDYGFASFTTGKNLAKTVTYAQPYTLFMVIKIKNFAHQSMVMDFAGTITNGLAQYQTVYNDYTVKSFGPVADANWQIPDFPFLNDTVIVGWVLNGVILNRVMNGVIARTTTDEVGNVSTNDGVVNGAGTSGVTKIQIGKNVDFDIYELMFFNSALSDTTMKQVDNYLHSKYEVNEKITLLTFGDSITWGSLSTSSSAGYVNRVAQAKGFALHKYALQGSSMFTHLRPNYQRVINKFAKSSYITICYGSNDSVIDAAWNTCMRLVVTNIIKSGFMPSHIILVTPPYSSTRAARLTLIQGYYAQCVTDFGVKYADCVTPTLAAGGDSLLSDGTHPADAGHQIMANTILAQIP